MNIIVHKNVEYKVESYWGKDKVDSRGVLYPIPKQGESWEGQGEFTHKLDGIEKYMISKEKYIDNVKNVKCQLCGEEVDGHIFKILNVLWKGELCHYVNVHNIRPSDEFIKLMYAYQPPKLHKRKIARFKSKTYIQDDLSYVKLDTNQIMILDALMKHGSYTKRYKDKGKKTTYRYSEHAGLLDFNNAGLERVIISGKTNRIDTGDSDIFLPKNMPDAIDYEYMFHTHPATPKPGGRADIGILYEFPSISDLFHFIDHYNGGITQGSIVIAPEGLYNIRKYDMDRKKIKINEDKMYTILKQELYNIQDDSISQYGTDFTTYVFYSKIAQDTKYIKRINAILNKFQIQIDYYPRTKDQKGRWIIDTVFLPIYITEPKR